MCNTAAIVETYTTESVRMVGKYQDQKRRLNTSLTKLTTPKKERFSVLFKKRKVNSIILNHCLTVLVLYGPSSIGLLFWPQIYLEH